MGKSLIIIGADFSQNGFNTYDIVFHKGGYWELDDPQNPTAVTGILYRSEFSYADKMEVNEGDVLNITHLEGGAIFYAIACLDSSNNLVVSSSTGMGTDLSGTTFTIPAGVKYLCISGRNSDTIGRTVPDPEVSISMNS